MGVFILQGINPVTHNDTSFSQSGRLCKYVIDSESLCAYQMPPNKSVLDDCPRDCARAEQPRVSKSTFDTVPPIDTLHTH